MANRYTVEPYPGDGRPVERHMVIDRENPDRPWFARNRSEAERAAAQLNREAQRQANPVRKSGS